MGVHHPLENRHRWIKINAVPLFRKGEKKPYEVYTTFEDITNERTIEKSFQESERLLKEAQAVAHLGHWTLHPKTLEVKGSDELFRIFGLDRSQANLDAFASMVHPEDREYDLFHIRRGLATGEHWDIEHRLLMKDGTIRTVHAKSEAMFDSLGNVELLLGTVQDITERKKEEEERNNLEEQLHQAAKMEAIGNLAGGIAHDFNNLLTGILGHVFMLKMDFSPESIVFKTADVIDRAATRAAELTDQLLAFARKGKLQNASVNLHRVIGEVVALLSRTIDKKIEIHQKLSASPSFVKGDPTQLHQIILNLCLNAKDAMKNGGTLNIETGNVTFDKMDKIDKMNILHLSHAHERALQYLEVKIVDTGVGISPENQRRIFEPFFTTKPEGIGTGMGLATVFGIVRNHKGWIEVDSEVDKGSTFRVYLPLEEFDQLEQHYHAKELKTGVGKVLLVDDEEVVLSATKTMLERMGYRVTTAQNGQEAVAYYKEHSRSIDVNVLDIIMPMMDGSECFRLIRKFNPDAKIIVTTGHALNETGQKLIDAGAVGFVKKPFIFKNLSEVLARVLTDMDL